MRIGIGLKSKKKGNSHEHHNADSTHAPPRFSSTQLWPITVAMLVLYFKLCVGRLLRIQTFTNSLIHTLRRAASTIMWSVQDTRKSIGFFTHHSKTLSHYATFHDFLELNESKLCFYTYETIRLDWAVLSCNNVVHASISLYLYFSNIFNKTK